MTYATCCSKPKAVIAPNGSRTSFVYNAVGNQIRTVAATGTISTTVYDVLNRPVASIDSFGKRTTMVYDAAGRTIATVNALNQRCTTVYLCTSVKGRLEIIFRIVKFQAADPCFWLFERSILIFWGLFVTC